MDERQRDAALRDVADQVDALQLTTLTGLQRLELELGYLRRWVGPMVGVLAVLVAVSLVISISTLVALNLNRAVLHEIDQSRAHQAAPATPGSP
ncbi:hypothetical protein DAETH_28770 [Deinococcus aetherius]|uniref:Uncharacterized protein n=1 Tax=Deinococcus aetherius TaxID=200252 RepID=A0ABM8AGS8_9DEIO|nr:hypothetical protein [Deinococcus aetherius]BDP42908.1 hypothetical protein DAETH_28770 [Deinococcus aetherius]